tara:strand:+ start:107 stop:277 length:171 start_codon:yes stop_codon:yes gene_type:complete
MERFFKKASGTIIKVHKHHDIESLKARFTECDAHGKELVVEKSKPKKKADKKKAGK